MNSKFDSSPQAAADRSLGAMMFRRGEPRPPAEFAARGWEDAKSNATRPSNSVAFDALKAGIASGEWKVAVALFAALAVLMVI